MEPPPINHKEKKGEISGFNIRISKRKPALISFNFITCKKSQLWRQISYLQRHVMTMEHVNFISTIQRGRSDTVVAAGSLMNISIIPWNILQNWTSSVKTGNTQRETKHKHMQIKNDKDTYLAMMMIKERKRLYKNISSMCSIPSKSWSEEAP